MGQIFRVICDSKKFSVCDTQDQAAHRAAHMKSRGHVTWIEPAEIKPTLWAGTQPLGVGA